MKKNRVDVRLGEGIAWLASKPKRIKIAVGGRGSIKTTGVSDIALGRTDKGERICCTREFQNSIDDSVHENLKTEIERLGVVGFDVQKNKIFSQSGGEIFYRGLARNITSLKSLAAIDMLWIEEGESISRESLKVLTPSIRSSAGKNEENENPPEIWVTMNWGHSTGAIAQKYLKRAEAELRKNGRYEDDLVMIVVVNWRDNPWFPPELEMERKDDLKNLPRSEYDAIWENAYSDTVPDAIIVPEWFDAALDAHIKLGFEPEGIEIVTHDVADGGGDNKALCHRHGSVIKDVLESDTGLIHDGARWALDYTIENHADVFSWDGDGMGVGIRELVSNSLTGKLITAHMFRGSESPERPNDLYMPAGKNKAQIKGKTNKQTFINKRAQFYWALRDRFYNTYLAVERGVYCDPDKMISISSGIKAINKLKTEICSIPRKHTGNGKIQILDKKSMSKAPFNLPSPNMADSVMMSLDIPELHNEEVEEINFDSLWS